MKSVVGSEPFATNAPTLGPALNYAAPSVNPCYRFTPDVLGYASIARGFKRGGFNDALGAANGISFGPETLINHEAGLKSKVFDGSVTANLAVFYMSWSKIQIDQDNPATPNFDPIISNACAAHSQGIVMEITARPNDRLALGYSISVQKAKYDRGNALNRAPLRFIPFAPAYTGNLNTDYSFPLGRLGSLSVFTEALLRERTYLTINKDPDGKVEGRSLFNARLTWSPANENLQISPYGKDHSDEAYSERLHDLTGSTLVGQKVAALIELRT
jgi:iron complex outermembrane recepter protein